MEVDGGGVAEAGGGTRSYEGASGGVIAWEGERRTGTARLALYGRRGAIINFSREGNGLLGRARRMEKAGPDAGRAGVPVDCRTRARRLGAGALFCSVLFCSGLVWSVLFRHTHEPSGAAQPDPAPVCLSSGAAEMRSRDATGGADKLGKDRRAAATGHACTASTPDALRPGPLPATPP